MGENLQSRPQRRSEAVITASTIILNVYDVVEHPFSYTLMKMATLGIHHTGIQIGMRELAFTLEGIVVTEPHKIPRCKLTHRILLTRDATEAVVHAALAKLQPRFTPASYDPLSLNCNHFSDAFCRLLGNKPLPGWVNRAPSLAGAMGTRFRLKPPRVTAPCVAWSVLVPQKPTSRELLAAAQQRSAAANAAAKSAKKESVSVARSAGHVEAGRTVLLSREASSSGETTPTSAATTPSSLRKSWKPWKALSTELKNQEHARGDGADDGARERATAQHQHQPPSQQQSSQRATPDDSGETCDVWAQMLNEMQPSSPIAISLSRVLPDDETAAHDQAAVHMPLGAASLTSKAAQKHLLEASTIRAFG